MSCRGINRALHHEKTVTLRNSHSSTLSSSFFISSIIHYEKCGAAWRFLLLVFLFVVLLLLRGINPPAAFVTTITNSYFLHPIFFDSRCFLRMLRAQSVFLPGRRLEGRNKGKVVAFCTTAAASSSCRQKGVYLVLFFLTMKSLADPRTAKSERMMCRMYV